jgi:hypothetical protein
LGNWEGWKGEPRKRITTEKMEDGKMGKWENGKMRKFGKMGKWENGRGKWKKWGAGRGDGRWENEAKKETTLHLNLSWPSTSFEET